MKNYGVSYKVDDYVSLYLIDALQRGDFYTWDIPQTYYTNKRSQVCTVTCLGGTIQPTETVHGLVISYVNGSQNSYTSGNDYPVLCHSYQTLEHSNNKIAFNISQGGELLVRARPNQIILKITDHNKDTAYDDVLFLKGCLTLKFCYYNQLETGENLHNQYNPTLE